MEEPAITLTLWLREEEFVAFPQAVDEAAHSQRTLLARST